MSTFAAARVETRIVLQGEGNAAKAVADVRRGLDGLDASAATAAKGAAAAGSAVEAFAKAGTQTAQRGGAAFAGLAAVLGGSVVPELAKAGQSLTAAGAAANILPGPIGLAAAAVAALALGAFELKKHFDEVAAKVANLGSGGTRELAERLSLSVDGTIKLEQALGDLPAVLRPTEALLNVIRLRAESMGKEGSDAVVKFAEALAKGPEALKAFEREFGRLAAASAELPDVAKRLGLSTEALGIAAQVGNEGERAKKAAEQAVVLERERVALAGAAALAAKDAANSNVHHMKAANEASAVAEQRAATAALLVRRAVEEANNLQEVVDKQKAAAAAATARQQNASLHAAEIAVHEAAAATITGTRARRAAELVVLQERGAEIGRQQKELQAAITGGLTTEKDARKDMLGLQADALRNTAARQAVAKQAAADLSAQRAKNQQANDAELASAIRLAKVKADAAESAVLPTGVVQARLTQLALEEAAEVGKAERDVNTAKGRASALQAIHAEFAAKRVALDKAVADNEQKLADDNLRINEAGNARLLELQSKVAEAVAQTAAKSRKSIAGSLRDAGKDEQADLADRQQAWADFAVQVGKIDAEFEQNRKETAEGTEGRANAEKLNLEQSEQAIRGYHDRVDEIEKAARARKREAIAAAADAIRIPAELLASSGGPGAKLLKALAATATGVAQVSRSWKEAGNNSPAIVGAVGQVAAAFVDGERQKAAILAITEAAAAVASYPNVPAMIAHGAAAVLYGAAAGGFIGGSGGGAPSVPSAGDLVDRASPADGAGGAGGGGNVVNVYFGRGFVVGTPQQVGAAVNGAVSSLKGTGLKQAKGV